MISFYSVQMMVDICSRFTKQLNLEFGTDSNPKKSKTKCLAFKKNRKELKPMKEIMLDEHTSSYVSQVNHHAM